MNTPNKFFIDELLNIPGDGQLENDIVKEDEIKDVKTEVKKQFLETFENLDRDISHIDLRLSHIQKFIVNFESQIDQLRNIIKNTTDSNKKSNLYTILNNSIELNARYEEIYIRCLDLKQKYRKEQSEANYKVVRLMEIELNKIGIDDTQLTPGRLAQMLNELSSAVNKKQDERSPSIADDLIGDISALQNDPKYRI